MTAAEMALEPRRADLALAAERLSARDGERRLTQIAC